MNYKNFYLLLEDDFDILLVVTRDNSSSLDLEDIPTKF